MKATSKKRILRMVILDVCGFCVLAYLVCAQVFRFFPWKPVELELPDPNQTSVGAVPTATPEPTQAPTPEPTDAPKPTDAPTEPQSSEGTAVQATDTPEPVVTPEPTPVPTPEPGGLLRGKFEEKFSTGGVISNDTEYRSENIAIELTPKAGYVCSKCSHTAENPGTCPFCGSEIQAKKGSNGTYVTYTVADIYIKDISCLRTAYVSRTKDTKRVKQFCQENNGILGVNTDLFINYIGRHGWFIRNGVEIQHNKTISSDLCILYQDGTMETIDYKKQTIDTNAILARNPQQIWYFGPELLDQVGAAKTKFNSSLGKQNPRTVVGYYEPGHYCFFVVDGRDKERGMTFEELSLLCADMGLKAAYNMDGGASSGMYFNGNNYGQNDRDTGDIVYIAEP